MFDLCGRFHGTLKNGPKWVPSLNGVGMSFAGSTDYVDIGTTFDISTTPFSIVAWVKVTNFADYRGIISKRDSYNANDMRFSIVFDTIGDLNIQSGTSWLTTATGFSANTWIHLGIVVGASSTTIFRNGVLLETLGGFTLGTDATAQGVIGADENNGSDPFLGVIGEIRVYSRALAAHEVWRLYQESFNPYTRLLNYVGHEYLLGSQVAAADDGLLIGPRASISVPLSA